MNKIIMTLGASALLLLVACGGNNRETVSAEDINAAVQAADTTAAADSAAQAAAAPTATPSAEDEAAKEWEGNYEAADWDQFPIHEFVQLFIKHTGGNKFRGKMNNSQGRERYEYTLSGTLKGNTLSLRQTSGKYEGSDEDGAYNGKFQKSELKSVTLTKSGNSYSLRYDGETGKMIRK